MLCSVRSESANLDCKFQVQLKPQKSYHFGTFLHQYLEEGFNFHIDTGNQKFHDQQGMKYYDFCDCTQDWDSAQIGHSPTLCYRTQLSAVEGRNV